MASEKAELPIESFASEKDFHKWLHKNHAKSAGLWLRFFKKASGVASVTYAEALDEALCYGWIDSQLKRYDDKSYIQRFTPRRPKGPWSKINRGHVARLISANRMQPAGLKEVETAKADGRWDAAYEPPSRQTVPEDFKKALARNKKAKAFFETLNRANMYAIYWRLNAAKTPETRSRWIERFVAMLANGETVHPQKALSVATIERRRRSLV
jgi:uncharacterized protein YdeI (YjbR/CyaY-like superfamily)